MSLEHINHKSLSFHRSLELHSQGINHGFCDRSINFGKNQREHSIRQFCEEMKVSRLNLLSQQHTDKFVIAEGNGPTYGEIEADAFIIPDIEALRDEAFGILTADCLPIIVLMGKTLSLIHSGWRGLANGIINKTIDMMCELSDGGGLIAIIGPAAGEIEYEVGEEVLSAIGENAVFTKGKGDKYLLSLGTTAEKIIKSKHSASCHVVQSGICVISNPIFFSYRREGGSAGRNLSFVKILKANCKKSFDIRERQKVKLLDKVFTIIGGIAR